MSIINTIKDNFFLLQKDFIGIGFDFSGIGLFFLHIIIAGSVFSIFYLLGDKIRRRFFKENKKFTFFVSIALGYIAIGTGFGLLGVFSLLKPEIIVGYLVLIACISLSGNSGKIKEGLRWIRGIRRTRFLENGNFIIWGVCLFIFIAFLRLMTPEIAEDGYHTDNAQLFVSSQTTIFESKEALHTIPFPQLPEMIYTIPIFFGDKEASRFIHFGFYVLIVLLLFALGKEKKYSFAKFLPLLFVTAPVVIRYSSTQYTDFFANFTFILAIFLIEKNISFKNLFLIGMLFGAAIAAKVWMIVYLPALVLYYVILNKNLPVRKIVNSVGIFLIGFLLIVSLWYIRAYIISGNPFFPIMNTFFIKELPSEINPIPYLQSSDYISFNWEMFLYQNLSVLSPFFFIGIISFFFFFFQKKYKFIYAPLLALVILITLEQLIIRVAWGRYLLIWFTLSSIFISSAIIYFYKKSWLYKYCFISLFGLFASYYFINTLLILPYGWGWSDKNAYLTRILGRDNVSYYDFDGNFDKWISGKDLVGMYNIGSFYYADFHYIDIGYIYAKKGLSFDLMRKSGVTLLMIKGGDIQWFCKELQLKDCDSKKIRLLATYPKDVKKYNLYSIVLPSEK